MESHVNSASQPLGLRGLSWHSPSYQHRYTIEAELVNFWISIGEMLPCGASKLGLLGTLFSELISLLTRALNHQQAIRFYAGSRQVTPSKHVPMAMKLIETIKSICLVLGMALPKPSQAPISGIHYMAIVRSYNRLITWASRYLHESKHM